MTMYFLPQKKITLFALLGIILVIGLGPSLIQISTINSFDQTVYRLNQTDLQDPSLIKTMKRITQLGGSEMLLIVGVLFSIIAYFSLGIRSSTFILLGLLTVRGIPWILKESTERLRPISSALFAEGFSFPSGHATNIAFLAVISYWLSEKWLVKRALKILMIFLFFLGVIVVGISRIILEVHWTSDVLAGYLLGLSIAVLVREWGKRYAT